MDTSFGTPLAHPPLTSDRDAAGSDKSTTLPKMAVLGLGAVGSMTLLALARRGVEAVGFERHHVGHDKGAFGGSTRRLRYAIPGGHGAAHVKLARRSVELWTELQELHGGTLYLPAGELAIGPSNDAEILSLQACMQSEGISHEVLTPIEVAERFPQHILSRDEVGIFARDGGPLRSNAAVIAAVRTAKTFGAQVIENTSVTSVRCGPHGALLEANGELLEFDHVIVTAGPWTGDLVPNLRHAFSVRRILSTWFEPGKGGSFAPAVFPPGFRRSHNGHASFTFLPGVDEDAAKFIFWIPERPEVANPSAWIAPVDEETVALTSRALSLTLRHVSHAPSRTASYLETFTRDRWPIVERIDERITVLTGFSGSGFALAPVMGEIASDLATSGHTDHDIEGMASSRFRQRT